VLGDLSPITSSLEQRWWKQYRVRVYAFRSSVLLVRFSRTAGHPVCSYELDVGLVDVGGLPGYLEGWMNAMQRRKRDREELESAGGGLSDVDFMAKWPTLWEHMTVERFDDGQPRKTSSLLVYTQDGRVKGMLKDKEEGEIAFLTAPSFFGLLESFEEGLREGKLDWRRDKEAPARPGGGPRKRG